MGQEGSEGVQNRSKRVVLTPFLTPFWTPFWTPF